MCGRFTLRASREAIAEQFELLEVPPIAPRYNIAPRQNIGIVRVRPRDSLSQLENSRRARSEHAVSPGGTADREFTFVRWGLIPHWADDPKIGDRLINARAETLATKPAFRMALRYRRCLIPADGFYEWAKSDGRKKPYFFRLPHDQLFAFAGLWEAWEGPDHSCLETATIITTDANDQVRPIHDRMPVILMPEAYRLWLDPSVTRPEPLVPLLQPSPALALEVVPVGPWVNNPAIDDNRCVLPMG